MIPTLNEARNIAACIDSVCWADEIVVVDSGSNDSTQRVAADRGARVVHFKWNGRFPKKKNWSLRNIAWKNEWILLLDADERVPDRLRDEIGLVLQNPRHDGFFINRKFLFMDKWIRHCGYYPSWNLRLFRHPLGKFEKLHEGDTRSGDNEVHEHLLLEGTTSFLQTELIHYAYPDIFTWIEKHNRYSNWEAEIEVCGCSTQPASLDPKLALKRQIRNLSRGCPFRPSLRFLYSFILKRGFMDGYEGYVLCRLLAAYELWSVLKAREIARQAVVVSDASAVSPLCPE